jgi:hypothetical protein
MYLGGIMKLIVIFCITLMLFSQSGFSQYCDTTLTPTDDPQYSYSERGNRCEGFYVSDISISEIDVVSVLQGKLYYDLDSNETVEISSEIVKDRTIYIRAQAIPLKTYYRMDAQLLPNTTLDWSINEVITPCSLSSKKIGLMGWYMSDGERIYVPLKTKTEVNSSGNDNIIRVVFRSTVDLDSIRYTWYSYETQESTGWQRNLRDSSRAGMPIVVNLMHEAQGRQLLVITGKVMNTEDTWKRRKINLIVR